ncbi:lipoprotein-releasing ABC transporter ATP-binding protein LolD [Sansalvadorimonas sp. 2012CJ34-2]|uniref:Lipoprotein-releasing system ATP-binding protein LolD n=1 Tax=Parendozoicomonas callyspongiae TaxID=2942213 RepID=A0ABT0PH05_9GAMM|nr:lipoprotein-releasing ABC transporter ATP-binding protein LolD [Sansalvadorimonas sp. 2012CJ34-2]MCL6269788.1 lipoprotein-releasing ABC transporter ATP-binding protein LolD [Sansalvadorimonas sp. 2012CJ34-2]
MSNVVLSCNGLTKVYDEGPEHLTVLDSIDFQVSKGERIAIVGSSGSGKTTLLNMLAGLDSASSGSVSICSQDMAALNENERGQLRNRHLGFVYQFHHLLPEFTALENVCMPLLLRRECAVSEARSRAEDILKTVGLEQRIHHKPSELSGGERQRVAIARSLVGQPSLVLMDEPTGNLDLHTGERIHQLMLELAEQVDTSFVVVTHDPVLAAKMDRVFQLREGQLVEG